jgi:hydroxyacylglutathione hydrolase
VGGPVTVDRLLKDGEIIDTGNKVTCEVMHTPGHSKGSISLLFEAEKAIMTGDGLPHPNDLPVH